MAVRWKRNIHSIKFFKIHGNNVGMIGMVGRISMVGSSVGGSVGALVGSTVLGGRVAGIVVLVEGTGVLVEVGRGVLVGMGVDVNVE
jgi:hypothetical protein